MGQSWNRVGPIVLKKIVEGIWNLVREKTLKTHILISSGKFKYKNAESNKGDGALPCDISDFFEFKDCIWDIHLIL